MRSVVANLNSAVTFLRARSDVTGRVGAMGWCFGGGIALSFGLDGDNHEATAIFYGRLVEDPAVLAGMDHEHADLIDEPVAVPDDEHPPIDLSTQATDSDKNSPHPQPNGQFVFVEHFTLEPSISSSVPHEVTVQEKMASVIRAYLKKHHNPRLDPGVDQLEPEDLNWRLLHFHYKGTDKSKAVKRVTIVFDDEFHNHVRKRGRELVTKDHLMKAGFASGGTLAVLITLFGLLKLKQARREVAPAKDLLASSGVWMV